MDKIQEMRPLNFELVPYNFQKLATVSKIARKLQKCQFHYMEQEVIKICQTDMIEPG